jgi:hypothetical protein
MLTSGLAPECPIDCDTATETGRTGEGRVVVGGRPPRLSRSLERLLLLVAVEEEEELWRRWEDEEEEEWRLEE